MKIHIFLTLKFLRSFFVCTLILASLPLYVHANSNSERTRIRNTMPKPIIGVSLPEQRSKRWVMDKDAIESFAETHEIDIIIRFSDNDKFLQAQQIQKLVNHNINILIIAAPTSPNIIQAIEYAKKNNVIIVSYDNLIHDTSAIDLFVGINLSLFPASVTSHEDDNNLLIDIDDLKKVINNDIDSTYFKDTRLLSKIALDASISLYYNKNINYNNQQAKKNGVEIQKTQVYNGIKQVPSIYISPIKITYNNYEKILFDSNLFSKKILKN